MPQPRTHAADLCCVNSGSQRLIKAYDRGTSGYLGRHTHPLSTEKLRELGYLGLLVLRNRRFEKISSISSAAAESQKDSV